MSERVLNVILSSDWQQKGKRKKENRAKTK
jgi:hypothetical protein